MDDSPRSVIYRSIRSTKQFGDPTTAILAQQVTLHSNGYDPGRPYTDTSLVSHKILGTKASYRSMGTTGDPVPVGQRDVPVNHFTG